MKYLLLAIIIVAVTTVGLFAEEEKTQPIEVSLFAFEFSKEHKTIFLSTTKGEPYEIELSKANILGPYKTVRNERGEVILRTRSRTEEGEVVYPALTKIRIPSRIKKPLLVLVPAAGSKAYKGIVVDRSLRDFPKGSYQLINFSPSEVRGLVGKTRVQVSPQKITLINPSSNKEERLEVQFQFKKSEEWKTFGRTRWVRDAEKRSLLCAYLDPRTQRMRIRGVGMQSIPPLRDRFDREGP